MKLILSNGKTVTLKPKDTVIFPLRDAKFDINHRHSYESDLARNVEIGNNVYFHNEVATVVDVYFME